MDTLALSSQVNLTTIKYDIWFWIALFELIIIVYLIYKWKLINKRRSFSISGQKEILKSKSNEVDMSNVITSMHASADLYKELSRKCHPDRFVNSPLQDKAQEIFQELNKNRRNHAKLLELKNIATQELKINF